MNYQYRSGLGGEPGAMEIGVVKIGGSILGDVEPRLKEAADLVSRGWKLVLVHGGGRLVDEYERRLGMEPRIVVHPSGVRSRYTSWEELEVFLMVMAGLVAKRIQYTLAGLGVKSQSLTGLDGLSIEAKRKERIVIVNERGRPQAVPGGYTGRITRVDGNYIEHVLSRVDVAVVSPVAYGVSDGRVVPLNVDGDQMAAAIAGALKAPLALVTDVPGVIVDGGVVGRLKPEEAEELAKRVGKGMNMKLMMAARAVKGGAPRASIGDAGLEDLLSGTKGTVITLEDAQP